MLKASLFLSLSLVSSIAASTGTTVGAVNAYTVVGRTATVCGMANSYKYHGDQPGQPIMLHLGGAFPHHSFAIRVLGANRGKFNPEVEQLVGSMTCASGDVVQGDGAPQMTIDSPDALIVM